MWRTRLSWLIVGHADFIGTFEHWSAVNERHAVTSFRSSALNRIIRVFAECLLLSLYLQRLVCTRNEFRAGQRWTNTDNKNERGSEQNGVFLRFVTWRGACIFTFPREHFLLSDCVNSNVECRECTRSPFVHLSRYETHYSTWFLANGSFFALLSLLCCGERRRKPMNVISVVWKRCLQLLNMQRRQLHPLNLPLLCRACTVLRYEMIQSRWMNRRVRIVHYSQTERMEQGRRRSKREKQCSQCTALTAKLIKFNAFWF